MYTCDGPIARQFRPRDYGPGKYKLSRPPRMLDISAFQLDTNVREV